MGVIRGDTRSLDYGSHGIEGVVHSHKLLECRALGNVAVEGLGFKLGGCTWRSVVLINLLSKCSYKLIISPITRVTLDIIGLYYSY